MGYTTEFKGELKFTEELTATQLAEVSKFLGEDCRNHPEWEVGLSKFGGDLYYIDLELTEDFSGLKWNGTEKTYSLDRLVNVLIINMRKIYPSFALEGFMTAQGEDVDDRWTLIIKEDGLAHHVDNPPTGTRIECPHCEQHFYLGED